MPTLPPWSLLRSALGELILPALFASAVVLVIVWDLTRRGVKYAPQVRAIAAPVALLVGLFVGNLRRALLGVWSLETGWPSLLSATGVLVAAIVAASLAAIWGRPAWSRALHLIAFLGCAWWLTPYEPVLFRLGLFGLLVIGSLASALALARFWHRSLRRVGPLLLAALWGGAAAIVLIYAHSARLADIATLLAASLAGLGLVAAVTKLDAAEAYIPVALFLPALMLAGATSTYSEVPPTSFVLVAFAPCALWLLELPLCRRLSAVTRTAAAVAALLLPLAIAVILAVRAESLDFG